MSGAGVDRAAAAAAATPHAWHTSYSLRIPPSEVIVIDDDSCEPESDRARQHHTATATATTTAAAATPATIKPADLLAPPRSSYDDASLVRATASANTHCASPHFLGHGAHQIYKDTAASATVALNAAAASSASAPNSLASTALNSQSSSLLPAVDVNAAVSSSSAIPAKDSDSSPHQPRYMTRSVAQNAAKRKQEELFPDNLELQGVHSGGPADASAFHPPLPTASSRRRVSQEYAALAAVSQVNPYSMMLSCNQQAQQQQSVTWTSSVLYQAARAVAAAAAGSSLTGAAAPASRSTRQKATATTASQQQPPAPKRRKNAAASNVATKPAAAAPRAARARAAPRAKQQPQQLFVENAA
ncbi:hypothetical protein EV174_001209 [Coemansia sp. RSA 2320]|nr:hypothetical protein EV174_001209 [Coemansia sp. RSA 2320]